MQWRERMFIRYDRGYQPDMSRGDHIVVAAGAAASGPLHKTLDCRAEPSGGSAVSGFAMMTSCQEEPADTAFTAEWEVWHRRREERLKQPQGWLALVGLHWLASGKNRFEGLPGVFHLAEGRVTLKAAPEDGYSIGGVPVSARELESESAEKPDKLQIGNRTMLVIRRGDQLALRVWDAASPLRTTFRGIDTFPPSARWRIYASW
ncbi:MAG TPA: hypothetical protein VMK12_13265, partial [Anaeromyxobacteraceae bacterium]|nr:hypothetical protein [Anaeromyxobacteraceae bacterium]